MKKEVFIKDLQVGQNINSVFLATSVQLKNKSNGENYLKVDLLDRSGTITANMWEDFQDLPLIPNQYWLISGLVGSYQGKIQLTIKQARVLTIDQIDLADFIPKSNKDNQELYQLVLAKIDQLNNPFIRTLLQNLFNDPLYCEQIKTAPAAKKMHNAYLGGLIEHIYDILHLAEFIANYYQPLINLDLLLAGVVFHDIGKIAEIKLSPGFEYSDEGKLLGHSIIGMEILDQQAKKIPDFPREIVMQIKHLILSHHGLPEWGSPKPPMTIEAVVLHYLDNLDSKVRGFEQFVAQNPPNNNWTNKSFMFNSELYLKSIGS